VETYGFVLNHFRFVFLVTPSALNEHLLKPRRLHMRSLRTDKRGILKGDRKEGRTMKDCRQSRTTASALYAECSLLRPS
jgi:hypothetical protein